MYHDTDKDYISRLMQIKPGDLTIDDDDDDNHKSKQAELPFSLFLCWPTSAEITTVTTTTRTTSNPFHSITHADRKTN